MLMMLAPVCEGFSRKAQLVLMMLARLRGFLQESCRKAQLMLMMLAAFASAPFARFLQASPADAHDASPVCEGLCRKAQLMLMMLAPFARVSAGKLQESPADAHDACSVCEGFCRKAARKHS